MRIKIGILALGTTAILAFGLLMSVDVYAQQSASSPFGLLSTSPGSTDFVLTHGGGHHGGGHHGGGRGGHHRFGHHGGHHYFGHHGFARHHGWRRYRSGGFWYGGTYYGTNCNWRWSSYWNKWVCAKY